MKAKELSETEFLIDWKVCHYVISYVSKKLWCSVKTLFYCAQCDVMVNDLQYFCNHLILKRIDIIIVTVYSENVESWILISLLSVRQESRIFLRSQNSEIEK